MKSKEEIKKWLLENCVDNDGDLDLTDLDFSDFKGDINISYMKVKNNLVQCLQTVEGNLYQDNQTAGMDLHQDYQTVGRNMIDNNNEVKGEYITQTLSDNEEYKIENGITYIVNNLKEITLEELEELGYKLKEEK